MNIFTRFAAATLVAVGFGTAAAAEQAGPMLVGSGDDVTVVYPAPSANVVGGAHARLTGSGETTAIEVIGGATAVQGPVGSVVGSGETQGIVYSTPAPAMRLAQFGQRG